VVTKSCKQPRPGKTDRKRHGAPVNRIRVPLIGRRLVRWGYKEPQILNDRRLTWTLGSDSCSVLWPSDMMREGGYTNFLGLLCTRQPWFNGTLHIQATELWSRRSSLFIINTRLSSNDIQMSHGWHQNVTQYCHKKSRSKHGVYI